MALFIAMLPVYLFGNLHCFGMCGPLVMMIGHHRYRYFYFFGRILSFSMAGMIAGAIGAVSDVFFKHYHVAAATSFLFGSLLFTLGIYTLLGRNYPGHKFLAKRMGNVSNRLSLLMMQDKALPAFLFGFFTIALPCGQTLIVFSACALTGSMAIGLFNGFAFALLTTPSLFMAMQAHRFFQGARKYYKAIIGISALLVGSITLLRGFAEVGMISHFVLNPNSDAAYHIVFY